MMYFIHASGELPAEHTPYSKMGAILVLLPCKFALVASFKGKYSFQFRV